MNRVIVQLDFRILSKLKLFFPVYIIKYPDILSFDKFQPWLKICLKVQIV